MNFYKRDSRESKNDVKFCNEQCNVSMDLCNQWCRSNVYSLQEYIPHPSDMEHNSNDSHASTFKNERLQNPKSHGLNTADYCFNEKREKYFEQYETRCPRTVSSKCDNSANVQHKERPKKIKDERQNKRKRNAVFRRNQRERNRVRFINETFTVLRKRLPDATATHCTKLSKLEILRNAISYIHHLRNAVAVTSVPKAHPQNKCVDTATMPSSPPNTTVFTSRLRHVRQVSWQQDTQVNLAEQSSGHVYGNFTEDSTAAQAPHPRGNIFGDSHFKTGVYHNRDRRQFHVSLSDDKRDTVTTTGQREGEVSSGNKSGLFNGYYLDTFDDQTFDGIESFGDNTTFDFMFSQF